MKLRIGNTKLANKIIERIMLPKIEIVDENNNVIEINNITSTELDFLLYLSLRQDLYGNVNGIYYKDVCLELNISKQSFYNALYNLEEKKYISIKNVKADYFNVAILNNKFASEKDYKKGYVNINKDFLHTHEFRKLKVNEKKLCLKLLMSYKSERNLDIYPITIARWLGIKSKSMSIIYSYVENIKMFFPNIRIAAKKCDLIRFIKNTYFTNTKSEREHYLTHKIKHFCRIYNINYTMKDLKDLIILLAQYAKIGLGKLYSVVCDVLIKYKSIECELINSLLSLNIKRQALDAQAASKLKANFYNFVRKTYTYTNNKLKTKFSF